MPSNKIRLKQERQFKPHRQLMAAAEQALKDAESERVGCFYDQLHAILHSALALEAIANTFGDALIDSWKDFDSCQPIGKLRIIAKELEVNFDRDSEPWAIIPWLGRVRNRLVHGRPEDIVSEKILTSDQADSVRYDPPKSKVEREISLHNAQRSCANVRSIFDLLWDALPDDRKIEFIGDSWTGSSSVHHGAAN